MCRARGAPHAPNIIPLRSHARRGHGACPARAIVVLARDALEQPESTSLAMAHNAAPRDLILTNGFPAYNLLKTLELQYLSPEPNALELN